MDKVSACRLKNLLDICNFYKCGKYDIEEFKSRVGTALYPEPETEIARMFATRVDIEYLMEELEGAIYAYGAEKAHKVADMLIDAINAVLKN